MTRKIPRLRLPYSFSALEPFVSGDAMRKHYALYDGYLTTLELNWRFLGEPSTGGAIALAPHDSKIARAARQAQNHELAFQSQCPWGTRHEISRQLATALEVGFGGIPFAQAFANVAKEVFGSGWVFVVLSGFYAGRPVLSVEAAEDGDQVEGAILALDLWEHAFYIDHPLARDRYVAMYLSGYVDWTYASGRLQNLMDAQA